jgi:hypothetical protein
VWLDLTRAQVLAQLLPRTLRRRLRRVELWNGDVEPPLWTILTERDHILLRRDEAVGLLLPRPTGYRAPASSPRCAWRTHPKTAARIRSVLASADPPTVVRLRNRREIQGWLDGPVSAYAAPDVGGAS